MQTSKIQLHEQFVVDEKGNKKAVVLDYNEYKQWKEDYEDLLAMLDAKKEPPITIDELQSKLESDGIL